MVDVRLPAPGDRYWHGYEPLRVREVDQTSEPPRLHVVHDHEWAEEVRAALDEAIANAVQHHQASDERR
jgi:hypothetical protein